MNFFSFSGRITRTRWWIVGFLICGTAVVFLMVSFFILLIGLVGMENPDLEKKIAYLLMLIPVCFLGVTYISLVTSAKRYHDIGKSGWWALIGFIPVVGPLWQIAELGFIKGSDEANEYGSSPYVAATAPVVNASVPAPVAEIPVTPQAVSNATPEVNIEPVVVKPEDLQKD